ncbi:MAG: UbiD family decarboxylase [Thermoproteota archaeon]|nr:UbiD family decarboxylase [Thermoproteota archaeon]
MIRKTASRTSRPAGFCALMNVTWQYTWQRADIFISAPLTPVTIGEEMKIAIGVGVHPAVNNIATAYQPAYGVDEM